jgi:hypothetical protein
MPLTKDQKDSLLQGFIQLGLSVILYLTFALLGLITAILTGFILNEVILYYIQGIIILLTSGLGGYFSIKVFQKTDNERLE